MKNSDNSKFSVLDVIKGIFPVNNVEKSGVITYTTDTDNNKKLTDFLASIIPPENYFNYEFR